MLAEAASLLDILTDEEHGQVLRLASIFLLGYLLPYSTGCDYYLLQNLEGDLTTAINIENAIVEMPLLERLQKSVRYFAAGDFGETLTDSFLDVAFDSFLTKGLEPLLKGREFHCQEVDLLHIFAMAIHPHPRFRSARYLADHPSLTKAQLLTESLPAASQFQIHYGHRIRIIQLIVRALVLPPVEDDDIAGSLLYGALPHLQSSLREFEQGARSLWDAHLSFVCLAAVSTQTQNRRVVEEVWEFLLHRMVDDRTDYGCDSFTARSIPEWTSLASPPDNEESFCPHTARGKLLAALLSRTCSSSPEGFVQKLTVTLADAVEWQVDMWSRSEDNNGDPVKVHVASMLASLLFVASHIFLFQPTQGRRNNEEDDPCEALVGCALKLVYHPDKGIASEAARCLVCAISHDNGDRINDHAQELLTATWFCLDKGFDFSSVIDLIAATCSKVPPFALALFRKLVENKEGKNNRSVARILAVVALNCPLVAYRELETLVHLLQSETEEENGICLTTAVLSSRHARFFAGAEDDKISKSVLGFLSLNSLSKWAVYRIARNALVSGNFEIAEEAFKSVIQAPVSEKNYLWMLGLKKFAAGETVLSKKGAMGIPEAVVLIRSSLSYIRSLRELSSETKDASFDFQVRFLLLRLDFLDLVTTLRQITREMRITSTGPSKYTRSHAHLCNVVKSFGILSCRFQKVERLYGLDFQPQSRTALRLLQGLTLFLAISAQEVFADILSITNENPSFLFLSHYQHPTAALIRRLDEEVLQPMDASLDPLIRSAAMLELIDAVLMTPVPFPRDFLVPKTRNGSVLRLLPSPSQRENSELNCISVWPLVGASFLAKGAVPRSARTKSLLPICKVKLWFRIIYVDQLEEDDGAAADKDDNKEEETIEAIKSKVQPNLPDLSKISPVTTNLYSDGQFRFEVELPPFPDEGLFEVQAVLGCEDGSGRQWDIPGSTCSLMIRVSRSG